MARDPNRYTHTETIGENLEESLDDKLDHKDKSLEHQTQEGLIHDLERTGHVLSYIESVSGEYAARQLAGVMQDSRSLTGVRQMRGDPAAYQEDTHEQYLQCILNLPQTLEAKQAMSPERWNDNQLQEAVDHEVNRMGYRINLEIRDRFMNQFDHRKGIVRFAEDRGVAGELLEMIDFAGDGKEHWIRGQRASEPPVHSKIESASNFYIVEIGLVSALEERDQAAARDFVDMLRGTDELWARAEQAMSYLPPEDVEMIRDALEIAAHWTEEQIKDGAQDYHLPYAGIGYRFSNEARERWLRETGQIGERPERTGDCAARALNEATGGQDYGGIWQEIALETQKAFPENDADSGVSNLHFREPYRDHGMKLLLARSEELNHIMRKHLDLREIPALMEGLIEEGTPLTYIACSDGHAVAVVDGVVHDTWNSSNMGDPEKHWKDGKLVELWIKTDDQKAVDGALEMIRKYETVRQYDDVLTYGRKRRETIPPPIPRELLEA